MISLIAASLAAAAAPSADSVLGRWQTPSKHGIVEIARCGQSICGTLLDSDGIRANPDLRDVNNKDQRQRGRQLRGLAMLQGFRWNDGAWEDGSIYNPEDGGTYKATVTPVDADHLRLRGCIVWPLCKTQNWVRVR